MTRPQSRRTPTRPDTPDRPSSETDGALPSSRRRLDADLPSRDQIQRLISVCSRRAPTGTRNAALIATAWRCGLRASELTALQVKDVDLAEGRPTVQNGKDNKRRAAGLDSGTAALLERWLVARRTLAIGRTAPLFCTLQGERIDTSHLRHLFKRLARRAVIERRVHPHALHHCFAVDLIEDGADPHVGQRALGHASAATTSTYLSRIGADDAVVFVRQRQWGLP
jgi:integrase/recombinase XerD